MAVATTSPPAVNERLVSAIWKSQLIGRQRLVTDLGQELQVVYPGRPCVDHGPDFRDALIAFDDDLRRGDVEIHCATSAWQAHRHHTDPHYSAVILHVVFEDDAKSPIIRADGQMIPTLALRALLPLPVSEIQDYLHTCSRTSHCSGAVRLNPDAARVILERAGDERLLSRAALVEGALSVQEPAQVLYELLFEALGYSKNKLPCRQLATILPFRLLENVAFADPPAFRREAMQAMLLGTAGLLPSQRGTSVRQAADEDQYPGRLECRWTDVADYVGGLRVSHPWHFSRVRPENFPPRRIVAASELLARCLHAGLVETFTGLFQEHAPDALPRKLIRLLCTRASDAYWHRRFDFGGREGGHESLLIGRERAIAIAVNAVLPFVLALGRHRFDERLCQMAIESYRIFPSPGTNELTRYVAGLLGSHPPNPSLSSARAQQGLLHIYHNWCLEKKCSACPVH